MTVEMRELKICVSGLNLYLRKNKDNLDEERKETKDISYFSKTDNNRDLLINHCEGKMTIYIYSSAGHLKIGLVVQTAPPHTSISLIHNESLKGYNEVGQSGRIRQTQTNDLFYTIV